MFFSNKHMYLFLRFKTFAAFKNTNVPSFKYNELCCTDYIDLNNNVYVMHY